MFHLFNKVYLEDEQWYSTKYPHLFVRETEGEHPIAKTTGLNFDQIQSFNEFIQSQHAGNEESFWESLIQKPQDQKFILFADERMFDLIQLRYWKSIFDDLTVDNAYKLYSFYSIDKKLKSFLYVERADYVKAPVKMISQMTFEEYKVLYDNATEIKCFSVMDKSNVSFEYLLADFSFNAKSMYQDAFKARLKKLSWNAWFNDVEILRSEIINSFYDIDKILPNYKLEFENIHEIESIILSEPKLRWILDPEFANHNINYVRKNYPKELFKDLSNSMRKSWDIKAFNNSNDISGEIVFEDHVLATDYVFDDKYEELLEDNIKKGFGCLFVNDNLRNKSNQLLPLFIYEKIREKKTSELSFLKLK